MSSAISSDSIKAQSCIASSARPVRRVLDEKENQNGTVKHNVAKRVLDTPTIRPKQTVPLRLGEKDDPQDIYDFDLEVFAVMLREEKLRLPDPAYFRRQTTVKPKMRSSIVDWMVDVHKKLKMHTDTLFTAVKLMDNFLSVVDFEKSRLQMLACTTLLIAGKSEEVDPPCSDDFVFLSRDSFSAGQMSSLEREVFVALDGRVNVFHSSYFMKRFLRITESSSRLMMLAHFLNEISLLDERLIGMVPSQQAAAVVCLALFLIDGAGMWTEEMVSNTRYELSALQEPCSQLLTTVHSFIGTQFKAIERKYAVPALCSVSRMHFPDSVQLE